MMSKIDAQAAVVAELRCDLADYNRRGLLFEARRCRAELAAAQQVLDQLVLSEPKTRAWSDRPEIPVRRVAQ